MAALWGLVGRGVVMIDFSAQHPAEWVIVRTDQALPNEPTGRPDPEVPESFIEWLASEVRGLSTTVNHYAQEALEAYRTRCYLASAICLAMASEAAFLEVARAFGEALPDGQRQIFLQVVDSTRSNSPAKIAEFRKRIEHFRDRLPTSINDGLTMALDSLVDLVQSGRNEEGTPIASQLARDDAFVNLQLFARYLKKLYALKTYFETTPLVD
jgi:hypothetical protein